MSTNLDDLSTPYYTAVTYLLVLPVWQYLAGKDMDTRLGPGPICSHSRRSLCVCQVAVLDNDLALAVPFRIEVYSNGAFRVFQDIRTDLFAVVFRKTKGVPHSHRLRMPSSCKAS